MNRRYYRGDIWFVREGKAVVESRPHGNRPAVIISNNIGNRHSPYVEVVFLTSKDKKYLPAHAPVLCKVPSIALCENVQTIAKDRLQSFIRHCTKEEMSRIDTALRCSFGLTEE